MEQRGQGQFGRRRPLPCLVQRVEHQRRMNEDVTLGMKLRRLLAGVHGLDLRDDPLPQAQLRHHMHGPSPAGTGQDAQQFLGNSLGGNLGQPAGRQANALRRFAVDRQFISRRKTDGAHQAQGIFIESGSRGADRSQQPAHQVVAPTGGVDELRGQRIVIHCVDGEVTPGPILFERAESDRLGVPPVYVSSLGAESGYFINVFACRNEHHAKMRPDALGPAEELRHLAGPGRGRNIDVIDRLAQKPVAHRPADKVSLMPRALKAAHEI